MKKTILFTIALMLGLTVNAYAVTVNVNGEKIDTQAEIVNGKAVAPVRDIFEGLNYEVDWDKNTNSVNITSAQNSNSENETPIFGLGDKANPPTFTNDVYLKGIAEAGGVSIVNVTFEQGCINDWHVHDHVQILMGTMGKGYCQQEGQEAEVINVGDVVVIPAGTKHWHGAAPNSKFTHISVSGAHQEGMEEFDTMWLEPVSQEEYQKLS